MPSISTLLNLLKSDYPQYQFQVADVFSWSPDKKTIYFKDSADEGAFLLHELSHAILGHADYNRDVELVAMERQAWDKAQQIAPRYNVVISDEVVESTLDTYRTWLHSRSTCPECEANGLQIKKRTYRCPACNHMWRVNEARICALRRYHLSDIK